jgi:hypothetical protein
MSYEATQLGLDRIQIRCTSGRSAHLHQQSDGRWVVEEDDQGRMFPTRGAALDCAREIALDPDWSRPQSGQSRAAGRI